MFVHSENSNNARLREPVRTSTLRQVTSTFDSPGTDLDDLQNPPSVPPQGYSQTLRSKVITIGVHDGSSTSCTALLDPSLFPQSTISRGTAIEICPVNASKTTDHARPHDHASDIPKERSLGHGSADSTKRHLFVAEPMGLHASIDATAPQVLEASSMSPYCNTKMP